MVSNFLVQDNSRRINKNMFYYLEGARGVMVIVVGNGHGDASSNPRQD